MDTGVQTEGEGGKSDPRLNVKLDDKGLMVENKQEVWRRKKKKLLYQLNTCWLAAFTLDHQDLLQRFLNSSSQDSCS